MAYLPPIVPPFPLRLQLVGNREDGHLLLAVEAEDFLRDGALLRVRLEMPVNGLPIAELEASPEVLPLEHVLAVPTLHLDRQLLRVHLVQPSVNRVEEGAHGPLYVGLCGREEPNAVVLQLALVFDVVDHVA